MSTKNILAALALLLAACGGGSGDDQRGGATTGPPLTGANIALLFMGNSHTSGTLHASDGNHSAPAGAFLAALVLYATITGLSPLDLPALPQYPVSASVQQTLRGIAAETVQTVPPRMWCPGDAF